MSSPVPRRPDLQELSSYHSAQVDVEVRLNVNESPFPPPDGWREEMVKVLTGLEANRYPDRRATELRRGLAEHHGVEESEVFCANGSNEVLQCLLLAYGGAGRRAACFEPTYALHRHISRITATEVVTGQRAGDFTLPIEVLDEVVARHQPIITFLCSPNNPTGRIDAPEVLDHALRIAPGLVVLDEAYGQFARHSALDRRPVLTPAERHRLVVVRTFSKTWSMAALRLGYLVAEPEVVASCEQVALPYHLSVLTQAAGLLALRFEQEMRERVAELTEERGRVATALGELALETWPSEASFILFRPVDHPAKEVWRRLVERSVLVRDCSSWPSLQGCLRVTIGTKTENDRFLEALAECLR